MTKELFRAAVPVNGHVTAVTRIIELAHEKDVPISVRDRQKARAWLDQAKAELAELDEAFRQYCLRMTPGYAEKIEKEVDAACIR